MVGIGKIDLQECIRDSPKFRQVVYMRNIEVVYKGSIVLLLCYF